MDETFDVGWDKGSPVTEDYGPIARSPAGSSASTSTAKPDLHPDHDDHHAKAGVAHAMIRQ